MENQDNENIRELQEDIESQTELLYTLIDNTNDMICVLDKEYKILVLNKKYKDYLKNHYKIDMYIGDNMLLQERIMKDPQWLEYYKKAFQGNRFSVVKERFLKNQTLFFEITFNPLFDKSKQVIGISWLIRDISEQKRLEKQLTTQNEELRVVNQELDRFVYSASHDLRAPLSSLLGLINLVRLEKDKSNLNMYLDMMSRSINKMDNFIKEIIYHSKNTRLEVRSQEVSFEDLFKDTLEDLYYMENSEKILKTIEIDQTEKFYSDKNRLRVILHNLLANAILYSDLNKEKPFIRIKVKVENKNTFIEIADNGQGIHPQHLDKIFQMFYRASQSASGSGLGLYMVKETLDKLEGEIEVDSTYGESTIFKISIPSL